MLLWIQMFWEDISSENNSFWEKLFCSIFDFLLGGRRNLVDSTILVMTVLMKFLLFTKASYWILFNSLLKYTFLTIFHTGISLGHPSNYLCKHLCLTSIIGQEPTQSLCYGISYKLFHNLLGVYSSYNYLQMKIANS